MATYKLKDKLTVNAGIEPVGTSSIASNGRPTHLRLNWTSPDKDGKLNVMEEVLIGETPARRESTAPATCSTR